MMGHLSLVHSLNGRFSGPGPSFHVRCTGHGQVSLSDAPAFELGLHLSCCFLRFGKHGHASGVHVQSVHRSRRLSIRSDVRNDGVQQAFGLESMPGLRTNAWWLVHDQQRLALVQHAQRYRPWTQRFGARRAEQQCVRTSCGESQRCSGSLCGRTPTFRVSFLVGEGCHDGFSPPPPFCVHGIGHDRLHFAMAVGTCGHAPAFLLVDVLAATRHVSQDGFHVPKGDVAGRTSQLNPRKRSSEVARTRANAPCDAHPRATSSVMDAAFA
eukprot:scaffold1927_cov333-Pavlova_lutheri.AAC.16